MPTRPSFNVTLVGEKPGPLLSDEGRFGVRILNRFKPAALVIRGAMEEIEFRISDAGRFVSARRRVIDQGQISRIAKYEILYVDADITVRSEEHTSELQSLMRISYAVFCLKKKHPHTKK